MNHSPITHWLIRLRAGEPEALDRLFPLVYAELKVLARSRLAREATGHTLTPTGLVHEAYLRLADSAPLAAEDRRHFFGIVSQAMRRVLIDHARTRKRIKRGSGEVAVPLDEIEHLVSDDAVDELIVLDDSLEQLARVNSRAAQIVEQRFFGGLTFAEIAENLGMSTKTVQRDWLMARAWLRRAIDHQLPLLTDSE
jgi:RNA polymerase sigma factor (TIGR02999 family)